MTRRTHVVFDGYDPAQERVRESLLALGNGWLFLRATAPEVVGAPHDDRHHYAGFYRAGLYDASPRELPSGSAAIEALVKLPSPFGLSFRPHGGDWLHLNRVELLRYRQRLDLAGGIAVREIALRDAEGRETQLLEQRLVSLVEPRVAALQWRLRPLNWSGGIDIRSVLDAAVHNAGIARNRAYEGRRLCAIELQRRAADTLQAGARLRRPGIGISLAVRLRIDGAAVNARSDRIDGAVAIEHCRCELREGATVQIEKTAALACDDDPAHAIGRAPPAPRHTAAAIAAGTPPFDTLADQQRSAWQRLWARIGLRAESADVERSLRFHAFHLLQTASPYLPGRDVGLPARGWQEVYYGQIFWDDVLAFPFLATRFPELTRGLLRYRHRRLAVARARASRAGYRGAMYPWRSARSGEEQTPPWQCNPHSGRWMPDHTRLQHHVGSAIAWNVWQHWLATGDDALLAHEGGEMLIEIARFWAGIAQWDDTRGRYVIRRVVGPDEYHNSYPGDPFPGLDNNAYTNVMAAWTLCRARELFTRLPPRAAADLRARLEVGDDERAQWDAISRRMYVPRLDDGVIEQFDGFAQLEVMPPAPLQDHPERRADWLLEQRGDSSDRYQITKQADVLMLIHLLGFAELQALLEHMGYGFSADDGRRTAAHYLQRITHESSLSRVVCAGALAHLDPGRSWRHYHEALHTDLGFGSRAGDGLHLGEMAGTLDLLLRHYLGVQPHPERLELCPEPPPGLGGVSLNVFYRGRHAVVGSGDGHFFIRAAADNREPLPLRIAGDAPTELAPGATLTRALR